MPRDHVLLTGGAPSSGGFASLACRCTRSGFWLDATWHLTLHLALPQASARQTWGPPGRWVSSNGPMDRHDSLREWRGASQASTCPKRTPTSGGRAGRCPARVAPPWHAGGRQLAAAESIPQLDACSQAAWELAPRRLAPPSSQWSPAKWRSLLCIL